MKLNAFKIAFTTVLVFLLSQTLSAQTQAVAPTQTIKMGAKKSLLEYLGSTKVDSNLIIPSRLITDTLNVYANPGNIFFEPTHKQLMYYSGDRFESITSATNVNNVWRQGGNVISSGVDSAIGTKNDVSVTIIQNNIRKFVLTKEGYVGINNISPQYHLDVNGMIKSRGAIFERTLSSALPTTYSDLRFKKDIQPIQNPLSKILNLKGVSYHLKTKEFPEKGFSDKKQFGLIAQDVENIIPEMVNNETDGFKSVSYSMLIPYLIEAVKEQNQSIQDLKKINF